jgi:NADH-quinone oxidoreductase subunit E
MTEKVILPQNKQYEELRKFIKENQNIKGSLINILYKAQSIFGYLPKEVQYFVAKETNLPVANVHGVVTFYNFFRQKPVGKYIVNVCLGTACHVKGADIVLKALSDELKVDVGETTSDGLFLLTTARCFGACGLAPVMMINDNVYGRLTGEKVVEIVRKIREEDV